MSDVYAFGCLYYEVGHNKHADSLAELPRSIMIVYRLPANKTYILTFLSRGTLPPRLNVPSLGDAAWSVIQSCWMREASRRPRMKDIAENMVSITQSMFLPVKTRDSFQELFELRTVPAQTLTVLRQELGLDDRDPGQMTTAERVRISYLCAMRY